MTPAPQRPSWQAHLDLTPPADPQVAELVAGIDSVAQRHRFERAPRVIRPVPRSAPDDPRSPWSQDGRYLHILAGWTRHPFDPDSVELDALSVWGSGLIRGNSAGVAFELLVQLSKPDAAATAAAMINAFFSFS